jgi:hypothetical protein
MPPHGVTGTWYVYRSDQVELTLSAAWMGNPFDINVRIVDNPAPLPAGDTGTALDPDLTDLWHVIPIPAGVMMPSAITRQSPPSPLPVDWTPLLTPVDAVKFTYLTLPDPPPVYQDFVIRETFDMPTAGTIFNMMDIDTSFLALNPLILTADQVANFAFKGATSNALGVNALNVFTDTHGGYTLNMFVNLNNIFTLPAIAANRVGYTLQQHYSYCNTPFAHPVIQRRITNIVTGAIELNKVD